MGKWIHILSDIDEENMTAFCAGCGQIVKVKYKRTQNRWACYPKHLEDVRKQRSQEKEKGKILRKNTNPVYWVYQAFSAEGALLYVGITNNPRRRFEQHKKESVWWSSHSRMNLQEIETKKEAKELERKLIQANNPLFNLNHNN